MKTALAETRILTRISRTEKLSSKKETLSNHALRSSLLNIITYNRVSAAASPEDTLQPAGGTDRTVVGIAKLRCANIFAQHAGEMIRLIVIPVIHG